MHLLRADEMHSEPVRAITNLVFCICNGFEWIAVSSDPVIQNVSITFWIKWTRKKRQIRSFSSRIKLCAKRIFITTKNNKNKKKENLFPDIHLYMSKFIKSQLSISKDFVWKNKTETPLRRKRPLDILSPESCAHSNCSAVWSMLEIINYLQFILCLHNQSFLFCSNFISTTSFFIRTRNNIIVKLSHKCRWIGFKIFNNFKIQLSQYFPVNCQNFQQFQSSKFSISIHKNTVIMLFPKLILHKFSPIFHASHVMGKSDITCARH